MTSLVPVPFGPPTRLPPARPLASPRLLCTRWLVSASLLAATLLAGCDMATTPSAPGPAVQSDPAPSRDACGAQGYRGLIGQPASVLAAMTFPIGTRQIGPDDAITADFRPDRLNIEYGRTGRIEKISCF